MNISIFGLGYVGCISLGCLAQNGHQVIGVDINREKVDLISSGKPTVIEKDIDSIIERNFNKGRIHATMDYQKAVSETEAAIICVGTPSTSTGHLNLEFIFKVARQIGQSIINKHGFYTIIIRSTVPPGTNEKVSLIIAKESGKKKDKDFAVVSNPEFMREGTAVHDYYYPPYTIAGSDSAKGIKIAKKLYKEVHAPFIEMNIKAAELLKYVNNSFHALKVTFANEVGNICKELEIDSHELMAIFAKDSKLNISPYYLKPGFAYGGSCLTKDLKALNAVSHDFYLNTPVLNAIENSNKEHIKKVISLIEHTSKKNIGFLGLSFKGGTDDLRSSPIVKVIEQILGKGFHIKIYDKYVNLSRLMGSNKSYIESKLPHINNLLIENINTVIHHANLIIIVNKEEYLESLNIPEDKYILDLTRINALEGHPNYNGICW